MTPVKIGSNRVHPSGANTTSRVRPSRGRNDDITENHLINLSKLGMGREKLSKVTCSPANVPVCRGS